MSELRVLHVIGGLQLGGAEALLYSLVERRSDVHHEVICLAGRDWYTPLLEKLGTRVHHLDIASTRASITRLPRLFRLVKQSRADVVQTWMYRANVLGGICARSVGKPVIWGNHTASLARAGWSSRFFAGLGGYLASWVPDYVINCSARTAEFHAALGYDQAPHSVVYNGIDPDHFSPDDARREVTRAELAIPCGTFVTGLLARFTAQKDVPTLLKAVRLAADRGVKPICLLAGRGMVVENEELQAEIHRSGCEELVRLLGPRSDVVDVARALDLHTFSSAFESFGNVVAETMLCETPNASTDVGETALMVGDTGWIVQPGDPGALAGAIEAAYHEWKELPDEWQLRRARARRRIADRFTLDRMADGYEGVWKELASRNRRPSPDHE